MRISKQEREYLTRIAKLEDQLKAQRDELLDVLKWWAEYAVNKDVPFVLISKTREVLAEAKDGTWK